jgi:hypothetical protein
MIKTLHNIDFILQQVIVGQFNLGELNLFDRIDLLLVVIFYSAIDLAAVASPY